LKKNDLNIGLLDKAFGHNICTSIVIINWYLIYKLDLKYYYTLMTKIFPI